MDLLPILEKNKYIYTHCYDYSYQQWLQLLDSWSEPQYRAKQILQGLYKNLWFFTLDIGKCWTNLPSALRDKLIQHFAVNKLQCIKLIGSVDNKTIKASFFLEDNNPVESVLIKSNIGKDNIPLYTLCISSQSGCPLNCDFCATGKMGFNRNLTCGEIIAQWAFLNHFLMSNNFGRITHIVYMGMGEPFLNSKEVYQSFSIFTNPQMINIAQRKITVSTIGIPEKIREFIELNTQINLAISLHAPEDDLRNKLVPINRRYPINEVLTAAVEYVEKTNRRITFEYALIDGVNDSIEQAQMLSKILKGLLCHVNLIVLNPSIWIPYKPSSHDRAKKFQSVLHQHSIPCTIRGKRGTDINAGCGQLALSTMPLIMNNI